MTVLLVLFCLVLSCLARELQMQIADGPAEMVFISSIKLFPCMVLLVLMASMLPLSVRYF